LVYWATTGKPRYVSMDAGQRIPYISGMRLLEQVV
jgi:hypothetical protein